MTITRSRVLHCALCVWFSVAAIESTARAQSSRAPQADNAQAARQLFDEGNRLARAGRWREAIVAFERSAVLREVPAVLYNLAYAHEQAGSLVDAALTYERFARSLPNTTDPRNAVAAQAIERVLAQLGQLTLLGELPTNESLRIDNAPVRRRSNGAIMLAAGQHHVSGARADGSTFEVDVAVSRGAIVELRPTWRPSVATLATLDITSPTEGQIWVDGTARGARSVNVAVAQGAHEIELRGASGLIAHRRVEVQAGARVRVLLEAPSAGPSPLVRSPALWLTVGGVTAALIAVGIGLAAPRPLEAPRPSVLGDREGF